MINKITAQAPSRPPSRRGRPKSQEKRDSIITAAADLFKEKGYAASMDEIAARAGVSKQTLYGHLEDKTALYRACAATWQKHYLDSIDEKKSLEETLRSLASKLLLKLLSSDTVVLHRLLIQQASQFPDLAGLHDELGPRHTIELFADYFKRQMAAGKLRRAEPVLAAEDFVALTVGQLRIRRLFGGLAEPSTGEIEAKAKHAVGIFMKAYGPQKND
jgi:TetR/AcrR family transcriptional repressor of mexJK operon